jgi:hypothetical protein
MDAGMTGGYQQVHDREIKQKFQVCLSSLLFQGDKLSTLFSTPVDNFIVLFYR